MEFTNMPEKKYFSVIKGVKTAKNYVNMSFHGHPKYQKSYQIVPSGPPYLVSLGGAGKKTLRIMFLLIFENL